MEHDKPEGEGEITWYLLSTNSKGKMAAHESKVLGNLPFSLWKGSGMCRAVRSASGCSRFLILRLLSAHMEVHGLSSLNFWVFRASFRPWTQESKYQLHPSYHCSSCFGSQFSAGADSSATSVNKGQADDNSTLSSKLKQAKDCFSEISAI